MTLLVSACGLLIGAAIGGLVAWARLSGKLLAGGVGQAYAALFRGLPEPVDRSISSISARRAS